MGKMSTYTNGWENGVVIQGVPLRQMYPGNVIWLGNNSTKLVGELGASDANKGTYHKPVSTLAGANALANAGDIVAIRPGYTQTISTAGGASLKAGVSYIGLGSGSLRPTLNFTATAATLLMNGANSLISNCLLTGGIDAVVSPLVVSAADCVIHKCEIRDVTGQVTDGILTTAGADRLKILEHIHNGATAAGTNAGIAIVGGSDIEITIKRMDGNFAVGGIDVRTTATLNLYVHDVEYFRTRNAADIFLVDTITGSTGQIGPNINIRLQDNAANITEAITGATFVVQDPVYVVNLAGEKGMLIDWTASTDA